MFLEDQSKREIVKGKLFCRLASCFALMMSDKIIMP